jgi:DNA replication protein DnaC
MNVIYLGGVGLGKTHLAIALGYEACLKGHSVLFASAIDVINTLVAAKNAGRLKQVVLENSNGYLTPLSAEVVPLFRSLLGSLYA